MSSSDADGVSGTPPQPSRNSPFRFGAVGEPPVSDQSTTPENSNDQVEFGNFPRFGRAVERPSVDEMAYEPPRCLTIGADAQEFSDSALAAPVRPELPATAQLNEPPGLVDFTMDTEGEEGTDTTNEATSGNSRGLFETPSASTQRSEDPISGTGVVEASRSERRSRRRIRRLNQLEFLLEDLADSTRQVVTEVERMLEELRDTRSMLSTRATVATDPLAGGEDPNGLRALGAELGRIINSVPVYPPPSTEPPATPSSQDAAPRESTPRSLSRIEQLRLLRYAPRSGVTGYIMNGLPVNHPPSTEPPTTPSAQNAAPRESTPPSPMSQRIQQIRQDNGGETPRQRPRRPQRRSATDSPNDGATTTAGSNASANGSSRRQRRRIHVPPPSGQGAPPRLNNTNIAGSRTSDLEVDTILAWNMTGRGFTETATMAGPDGRPVTYEVLRPWFMGYFPPPMPADTPNTTRRTSAMREQIWQQRRARMLQVPLPGVAAPSSPGENTTVGGSNADDDVEQHPPADGECAGSADGTNAKGHCRAAFVGSDWLCQYCRRGL